ncbi:cupin domain-containing protein [Paraburkholderia sp. LEh10]|uniref:cupin domain-containing protein n=1 Tax=Paraburkholderia sp. LEh10 TaxID=2821353 RepID=UPI001AE0EC9F|nr:cupin domain-containing protein [Paraburkholderia sp. LEh10]MBP0595914.1 cupin domain-containing protein [Paraburkholderia sp. LEh10]
MQAHTRDTVHAEAFRLSPRDWVPNNGHLPVILYRDVLVSKSGGGSRADAFEAIFTRNGWPPKWRNSIFDYHHFHSSAHEVLAVAAGTADVIVGGPGGRVVHMETGDVILLPAGTGHCLASSSGPLCVIGAYPPGQQWDIRRDALNDDERRAMEALPFPHSDPVLGARGPLTDKWLNAA